MEEVKLLSLPYNEHPDREENYYSEIKIPTIQHKIIASWESEIYNNNMVVENKVKEKDYKVFVIGSAKSYGSWIQGRIIDSMEDADVVVLTGGEDISPKLYNEEIGSHAWGINGISRRDAFEVEGYEKAKELGKVIWGTCRGAQLLCAMAGGKLIQHMNHGSSHKIYFYDKEYNCTTNTLHHQMQYPYTIPKDEYFILANSHGLSNVYLGSRDMPMEMPERTENGIVKEPEFVYYPKIKGLGIQGHPEMMGSYSELVKVCHSYLNLAIENKLDKALALNISAKEIMSRAWNFKFTKEENELYKQIVVKQSRNEVIAE